MKKLMIRLAFVFGCLVLGSVTTLAQDFQKSYKLGAGGSTAGAQGIQDAIREGGCVPQLRNQQYEYRELPENMEQQSLNKMEMIVD